ncbi:hypothetical protein QS713_04965 [Gleimia hominis]|uniref:Aminoglycoside phosphotransferase domain-containing protein n=1 Tax=Gleimia hominis TaxID=595468 RepID=A0ABU3IAM1_9ACTO|nr:phosphotransferase [Gleimia hominis]MDT3767417.1 hypothetical protein [Gleimia hominis]
MSASWPEDLDLLDAIGPWLYAQRWFPGQKGDQIRVLDTVDLSALSVADPANEPVEPVWISLIEVGENLLSVPLVYTDQAPSNGVVAHVRDAWIVDGAYSPLFLRAWIREAYTDGTISPLAPEQAEAIRDRLLQVADQTHVISGEQSNTSVVFPGDAACVVKFLRVLHPGVHPELEVTQALAATGWECVAAPVLYAQLQPRGEAREPFVYAIGGALVRDGQDGFELFVQMAREAADPAALAHSLGQVTAQMHERLADAFGASESMTTSEFAQRLTANIQAASAEVPALKERDFDQQLIAAVHEVENLSELPPVIRVHGDYHLGQTMHSDAGWTVLDFEGEPLRSLADRRQKDFALRDVAGMLRSFDYAGAKASAGAAWTQAAQDAFLNGYTSGGGLGPVEQVMLRALLVEKATYETVYEYRMRPEWIDIPLRALKNLT